MDVQRGEGDGGYHPLSEAGRRGKPPVAGRRLVGGIKATAVPDQRHRRCDWMQLLLRQADAEIVRPLAVRPSADTFERTSGPSCKNDGTVSSPARFSTFVRGLP
jgi:hypothetical protein